MFIRTKKSPNTKKISVQIVESFRVENKVRQRILRHVGNALDNNELNMLMQLAQHIKLKMESDLNPVLFDKPTLEQMVISARQKNTKQKKQKVKPLPVHLSDLREEARIVEGIHLAYGHVYDTFGFDKVLSSPNRKVASVRNLRHCVMGRLANPVSKRATAQLFSDQYGVPISSAALYRMMEHINDEVIERIQKKSLDLTQTLFEGSIKVVFYDCTTLYFESFKEDDLKANGYSKDMKFNQPQVLLGLIVTAHGLPLGYDLFAGNTYEGHTLQTIVENIEHKLQTKDIIFVADSGLFNKNNLEMLESKGKKYIVGARIKNQPQNLTLQILNTSSYESINNDLKVKQIPKKDRTLIVSHSQKRALKDSKDRQKSIDKLMVKISKSKNATSLMSKNGYQKYIQVQGSSQYSIDQKKIEESKRWDGLHAVITNIDSQLIDIQNILDHYHGLWQVEQCFRVSKTDLKFRPIYHWTPRKIKAHIAICYMALCCARYLYHIAKIHALPLSEKSINYALTQVQTSILKNVKNKQRYVVPSKLNTNAEKIFKLLGIKFQTTPYKL